MLLKDYIPYVPKKLSKINFSGVAFDSSRVKKNDIFFAIKGKKFDGNNFISHAIKKGAKVIVSENKKQKKKIEYCFVVLFKCEKIISRSFL